MKIDKNRGAIYIHIPFCTSRCLYCDFYSEVSDGELIYRYIENLTTEFERYQEQSSKKIFETIFIGGGTPSLLDNDQLEMIVSKLYELFNISPDAEVTMEMNPESITVEKGKFWRQLGINRASIGFQSANDTELKLLDRTHTAKESITAFDRLRKVGFDNISIDLIYNIEGQSRKNWVETLREVGNLMPEHISAYELTIDKGSRLANYLESKNITLEHSEQFFDLAVDLLNIYSYQHYEVSNFARDNFQSRHNLKYWNYHDYIGFGPAAHSKLGDLRWSNINNLQEYSKRLIQGGLPIGDSEKLTNEIKVTEKLMLGLRIKDGLPMEPEFNREAIELLIADRLLKIENNYLKATKQGMKQLNFLLEALV
ncbi:MAG: radical SAM family heme chaperone HemW [Nitrospinota bacterium]